MKIQSTDSQLSESIKMVIAGEAGNGKTTLAKTIQETLGERVFVISAEAGLLSLRGKDVDFIELQRKWVQEEGKEGRFVEVPKQSRIAYLAEIYKWLLEPAQTKKYRWVFIDSLTEINQNLLENLESILDEDGKPAFAGPKNMIKKYGELATRMRSLCKTFRDIPHYNVIFSALVKNETDADNQQKLKIDITGKFADQLPALFDEILYLGVSQELNPDGSSVRLILTQKTDKITFPKDRSGTLSRTESADLGLIVQKIRKGKLAPVIPNISLQAKEAHAESVEIKEQAAQ